MPHQHNSRFFHHIMITRATGDEPSDRDWVAVLGGFTYDPSVGDPRVNYSTEYWLEHLDELDWHTIWLPLRELIALSYGLGSALYEVYQRKAMDVLTMKEQAKERGGVTLDRWDEWLDDIHLDPRSGE